MSTKSLHVVTPHHFTNLGGSYDRVVGLPTPDVEPPQSTPPRHRSTQTPAQARTQAAVPLVRLDDPTPEDRPDPRSPDPEPHSPDLHSPDPHNTGPHNTGPRLSDENLPSEDLPDQDLPSQAEHGFTHPPSDRRTPHQRALPSPALARRQRPTESRPAQGRAAGSSSPNREHPRIRRGRSTPGVPQPHPGGIARALTTPLLSTGGNTAPASAIRRSADRNAPGTATARRTAPIAGR